MYSEQLAVFLLVLANGMSGQTNLSAVPTARLPHGGAQQLSLNLKLDPNLKSFRNPYTGKIGHRKTDATPAFLARAD